MATNCVKRPDIHGQVLQTIERVHAAHERGEGLPLVSLIELFGVDLNASDRAQIEARGSLRFQKSSEHEGEFFNDGPAITLKKSVAKVTVPARIGGEYFASADMCSLSFDDGQTITLSISFFVKSKLESVLLDQTLVKVDLEGTTFDQCFIHKS